MSQNSDPKQTIRRFRAVAMVSSVGLTLALSVGIGIGFGLLLDRWFHTNWLVIVFTLLGVVAGFQQLIRTVIQANAEQEAIDAEEAAERRNSAPRNGSSDNPGGTRT